MWHSTHVRMALALTLALYVGAVSRGDDVADAAPAAPEAVADRGFPWLCFITTVGAVAGLYVFVRRREQAAEAERKRCGASASPWYCRVCARDVSGPECPLCRAANPFLSDWTEGDIGVRPTHRHS
jgi:hypothetical protein